MPRRDFTKVPFAATGDVTSIPAAVQPDGSVSMAAGYGFDYQRDNGAGGGIPDPLAKSIGREDMNGIFNEITASVGEIQQNGFPIWAASAAPYPINAVLRHNNIVWQSVVSNNSDQPGVSGGLSSWKNISDPLSGRLIATQKFITNGTYTPTPGMVLARVRMIGGGGGSGIIPSTGASQYAAAGGGASGSFGEAVLTAAQVGAGLSVTVGAAGAAGAAGSGGGNGGATSLGALLSCPGGGGSFVGTVIADTRGEQFAPGDPGGLPTGAFTDASAGQQGLQGLSILGATRAGSGAPSIFGSGGIARGGAGYAFAGSGFGSGASGAASSPSSAAKNGAAGAGGVIIIEEFS